MESFIDGKTPFQFLKWKEKANKKGLDPINGTD